MEALTIHVRGGGAIWVPDSASYLSTYVLLEQEDWFEKEITFVRRVLRPGMRAVDIGANFGCYTLAMSRAVGPTGALWLFEPTTATFNYLSRTLASNELSWAKPHRLALSDREGTASLSLDVNSELNSLGQSSSSSGQEVVNVTTLDRARVTSGIESVDFVKLDAEGEEVRIIAGGQDFLRTEDPLVMFEVKHGSQINVDLPKAFERLGYHLYRLVGPDTMLVPATVDAQLDGFELNLFACKPGRAAMLAAAGVLIDAAATTAQTTTDFNKGSGQGLPLWRLQPFATAFAAGVAPRDPLYAAALDHYALWRDTTRRPPLRFAALQCALRELIELVARARTLPRMFMLARVAREAGARTIAVQTLNQINEALGKGGNALDEPCWPALERFDGLTANGGAALWLGASAAEALIVSGSFSGYFSGPVALPWLDWLHASRYASAPMERRRELQAIFANRRPDVEGSALLQRPGEDNLNPHLWAAGTDLHLAKSN